jgi:hypothetical protein
MAVSSFHQMGIPAIDGDPAGASDLAFGELLTSG